MKRGMAAPILLLQASNLALIHYKRLTIDEGVLFEEGSVVNLHGGLFCHLAKFAYDIIVGPSSFVNESLAVVNDGIGKNVFTFFITFKKTIPDG